MIPWDAVLEAHTRSAARTQTVCQKYSGIGQLVPVTIRAFTGRLRSARQ
jgi:hypothetical protein